MTAASGSAPHLVLAGELVVVGKQPDGDSVRFRPDDPRLLRGLVRGEVVRPGPDGTVQVRLDGVDAPELHHAGARQPYAETARDALLATLGFEDVQLGTNAITVTSAEPVSRRAVIAARLVTAHGCPVAFVFTGDPADELVGQSGEFIDIDARIIEQSRNAQMIRTGHAYPLLYTSTPPALRKSLAAQAIQARHDRLGVWALDSTARFEVIERKSVEPGGALILPKLFRRVVEWMRETEAIVTNWTATGLAGPAPLAFPDWLAANPGRDDEVRIGPRGTALLHELVHQARHTVTLNADPTELVFVES